MYQPCQWQGWYANLPIQRPIVNTSLDRCPTVWISAAETSADLHGARLIQALVADNPGIACIGVGGPEMRSMPFTAVHRSEELSVMGLTEVLASLPRILRIFKSIKYQLRTIRPDCLILLDAPDFHFRVAKMASRMGIPVYYYISPQIWAWRKGRIRFIQKYVHKMLCIFPFEKQFFAEHGVDVEFVGHPLMEELEWDTLDQIRPDPKKIGILPGSRSKEISALLPAFASAARGIAQQAPGIRFQLFLSSEAHRPLVESLWPRNVALDIIPFSERYAAIKGCGFVLTASGTATLECALLGVPAIVAYRVSRLSYLIARMVVDVPYISMTNIILQREVFPEFIQARASGNRLTRQALVWMQHPDALRTIRERLRSVQTRLGQKKASTTCAQIILQALHKECT